MLSLVSTAFLLSLISLPNDHSCYSLAINESDVTKTIEWGDPKYKSDCYLMHKIQVGKHDGITFITPTGTKIKSYSKGKVISVTKNNKGYGNSITIKHDSNLISFYGHIDTSYVKSGQEVACGQSIGETGISGTTVGPKLYFKVIDNGVSIDPREKINRQYTKKDNRQ